jgi:methylthioribose-1-phosphate isomerase
LAHITPILWDAAEEALIILDQTQLPMREVYLRIQTEEALAESIATLRVRGAPVIGVAAAWGVAAVALRLDAESTDAFCAAFTALCARIAAVRPTAVNLPWAMEQMVQALPTEDTATVPMCLERLKAKAAAIERETEEASYRIAANALPLVQDGWGILTHCNAGRLACLGYGTATAPLYLARERGMQLRVYADETRPLLQGARLTVWELTRAGMDVTLLCEGMAASLMAGGRIQAVLVGADRIARNGDTANKVGTLNLAILAKHFGIPFYVLAPESTFDRSCSNGAAIPIEQRGADEVTALRLTEPAAPAGISVYNPAFDVTPHGLITAWVSETGVKHII